MILIKTHLDVIHKFHETYAELENKINSLNSKSNLTSKEKDRLLKLYSIYHDYTVRLWYSLDNYLETLNDNLDNILDDIRH